MTVTATATPAPLLPAGPAILALPAGVEIDAVVAGTLTTSDGTMTLTGSDGATYIYTNVVGLPGSTGPVVNAVVHAGERIGTAGVGGITFAIALPDVSGPVCAWSALADWSQGVSFDVRALPQTCTAALGSAVPSPGLPDPARAASVLILTDAAAGSMGADVAALFSGTPVTARMLTLDESSTVQDQVAQISAAQPVPADLVVVSLAGASPDELSGLAELLPPRQSVLWVKPPARTPNVALDAAERTVIAAHPNIRVQTPPPALAVLSAGPPGSSGPPPWTAIMTKVLANVAVRYAGSAYRLPLSGPQASAVLAYAQAQLSKPYEWAAAGPATFDCSGLTMMAFRQVGLDFIHNAYAQYEATKQYAVASADLQPADLVFFGPNEAGIHHVGIYVGNGVFIDAPDRGTLVRFDTLGPGWDYLGATRPLASSSTAGLAGSPGGALGATGGLDENQAFARALSDATWDPSQFSSLVQLWNQESNWDPKSLNPTSGAYGIPQALPADKMASAGSDWATDPFTQIIWGTGYIQDRYGTPAAALAHEKSFGWY